jgi:hypothetical protein
MPRERNNDGDDDDGDVESPMYEQSSSYSTPVNM